MSTDSVSTEKDRIDRAATDPGLPRDPDTYRETVPASPCDIEEAREIIETLRETPHHTSSDDLDITDA